MSFRHTAIVCQWCFTQNYDCFRISECTVRKLIQDFVKILRVFRGPLFFLYSSFILIRYPISLALMPPSSHVVCSAARVDWCHLTRGYCSITSFRLLGYEKVQDVNSYLKVLHIFLSGPLVAKWFRANLVEKISPTKMTKWEWKMYFVCSKQFWRGTVKTFRRSI